MQNIAQKKAVTDASKKAAKETAKETAKESAKIAVKISAKAAGAAAGTAVGPEGTVIGYVVGEAAGQLVGEKLDQMDYKAAQRNRKIKFFLDKMKAENEQTDSLPKLLKDLAKRKAWMWVKSAAPAIGIGFLALVLIIFVAVIPVVTTTTVLYNSPFAILLPSLEEGDTVITVMWNKQNRICPLCGEKITAEIQWNVREKVVDGNCIKYLVHDKCYKQNR